MQLLIVPVLQILLHLLYLRRGHVIHPVDAAGVLLGTAAYMSPEQARGKPVDKRADIWAFGCVLWEMLIGQRLFTGDTVSDVLAAVLREEPDWKGLPASTPLAVRRLFRRCLQRDPGRRLHDIADARLEIEDGSPTVHLHDESGNSVLLRLAKWARWSCA